MNSQIFAAWSYVEITLQTVPLERGVGFIYLFKLRQLLEEYNLKKPQQYLEIRQFKNTFLE